jgi:hypothetical protein
MLTIDNGCFPPMLTNVSNPEGVRGRQQKERWTSQTTLQLPRRYITHDSPHINRPLPTTSTHHLCKPRQLPRPSLAQTRRTTESSKCTSCARYAKATPSRSNSIAQAALVHILQPRRGSRLRLRGICIHVHRSERLLRGTACFRVAGVSFGVAIVVHEQPRLGPFQRAPLAAGPVVVAVGVGHFAETTFEGGRRDGNGNGNGNGKSSVCNVSQGCAYLSGCSSLLSFLLFHSVAFRTPHPRSAAQAFLCEVEVRVWNGAQGGVVVAKVVRRYWVE